MSSHCADGALSRPRRASNQTLAPAPLFVCPGAKEVTVSPAIFPYESGFSALSRCPARDTCLWYAGHDLGGEDAFNEYPDPAMLAARFSARPFSCPDFKPQGREVVAGVRGARKFGRTPAALLLLQLVAALVACVLPAPLARRVGSPTAATPRALLAGATRRTTRRAPGGNLRSAVARPHP